ncbi:MAG: hypothetical protein O7C67_19240 [Gammaproteobacteria bacterium]|nr:hypothetical protein [Gammaproteobacteria bacterium]
MNKLVCLFLGFLVSGAYAADYPNMQGVWAGTVRTLSSGEQVRTQVARGGALIQDIELRLTVNYQDQEVFIGETISDLPDAQPVPVWGAIRSTGEEGVFVTANGGRGNIWFTNPSQFEFCFANQTPEQMSAYCAVLDKRP